MAQQAARADKSPPTANLSLVRALDGLGRDWTVLKGCRLRPSDRGGSPDVLIHPGQGIAVLDVSPSETPDAVEAVRAKLDAARFDGIFAGHLPVVHLRLESRRLPSLPVLLDDAFAALPPLHLPGGDAWAGVASRALLAEYPSWPRVATPPARDTPARDTVADIGPPEPRTRRRRRRGAGLRKLAAVLVCLAALGGVLAAAAKDLPALEASARAALAAAVKDLPALEASVRAALAAAYDALPSSLPRPSEDQPPPEAVALPAAPVPEPARSASPPSPAEVGGGATVPIPPSLSSRPEAPEAAAPAAVQPTAPPQPRRPEPPPPQTKRPPERAAPAPSPQQQRRSTPPQQEAGTAPPLAGDGAPSPEAASQRCRRVGARIGSGAPIGDADMRFFNEACIRW